MTARPRILGLGLALLCLGSWPRLGAQTAPAARAIRLDIPADWEPVLCRDRLLVFSTEGRNQLLSPGDAAPQCDPVQFTPALQPVCTQAGTLVLDAEGNLWQLGDGLPKTIQSGMKGAVAMWPAGQGAAFLFKDRLELPGGARAALPFEASDGNALSDGGSWVWGARQAARLSAEGALLWTWTPAKGAPGPGAFADGYLVSGASDGTLWALDGRDGKAKFGYKGGGALFCPPLGQEHVVIAASADHLVRAVNTRNGQLLWQYRTSGRPAFGPYPVAAGILLAEEGGSRLVILSPKTGKAVWTWLLPSGSIIRAPAVEPRKAALLAWDESATPTLFVVELPASPPAPPGPSPDEKKAPVGSAREAGRP